MLSVRLVVNSKLFVVKFWGVKSYMWIFNCAGGGGSWCLSPLHWSRVKCGW